MVFGRCSRPNLFCDERTNEPYVGLTQEMGCVEKCRHNLYGTTNTGPAPAQ